MKPFKLVLVLFLLVNLKEMKSQIPSNDPAWILQTNFSEEFNSTLDTINKWRPRYTWGNINNGAEYNYPSNLIQTGTTLKIKVDTLTSGVYVTPSIWANPPSAGVTYAYQGGILSSMQTAGVERYKYGYIEGYAKMSTSYWPYWGGFWLFGCGSGYNEIDFFEPNSVDCFNGTQYGTNVHLGPSICQATSMNYQHITNIPLMSAAFHKYAIEWAPDRLDFYFDDVVVRSIYDPTGTTIPQNPMMLIINLAIDPYFSFLPSNWNNPVYFPNYPLHGNQSPTQWPQYFEIDYLRYYKLNVDCNNNLNICTPSSDYNNRPVVKTIVAGGTCSPTFNTSDAYTLRATDYILLDAGSTINDNGSGYFAAITMQCPQ